MAFAAETDQRPVRIDSNGLPLASGRLYYFELDGTTPKTVYSNTGTNIALDQPVTCDSSGRTAVNFATPTQVYLGAGGYNVVQQRFEGTDPLTDPDNVWVEDNRYNEYGLAEAISGGGVTDVSSIGTIAGIRAIPAPTEIPYISRIGYYAAGDSTPISYTWIASDTRQDNGGTVLKSDTEPTGSWVANLEGDTLDSEVFGVIAGYAGNMNSQIVEASNWIEGNNVTAITLYFRKGVYQVTGGATITFDHPVKMDKGVYFDNTVASQLVFEFNEGLISDKVEQLHTNSSLARVYPKFENLNLNFEVDVRWFGCVLDGGTPAGGQLYDAIQYTSYNNTLLVGGRLNLEGLTADIDSGHKWLFTNNGQFINNQSDYTISFVERADIILSKRINAGVFGTTNMDKFYWSSANPVQTKWFMSQIGTGSTNDLSGVAKSFGAVGGTRMVMNAVSNRFTTGLDEATPYIWEYESGSVVSGISAYIIFYSSRFSGSSIFDSAWFVVKKQISSAAFWDNGTASDDEIWQRTIESASLGTGQADFNGGEYTISGDHIVEETGNDVKVVLRNGTVTSSASAFLYKTRDNLVSISVRDLFVNAAGFATTLVSVDGTNVSDVSIKDSEVLSSTADMVTIVNSGSITNLYAKSNYIVGPTNFISSESVTRAYISDNTMFNCTLSLPTAEVHVTNNDISGRAGAEWVCGGVGSTFANNKVTECDLVYESLSSSIVTTTTGNSFVSSNTKYARVIYKAEQASTKHSGTAATGNSFSTVSGGLLSTTMEAFVSQTGAGDWTSSLHSICITGNRNVNRGSSIRIPETAVSFQGTMTQESALTKVYLSKNLDIFHIPGSSPYMRGFHLTLSDSSFNITPDMVMTTVESILMDPATAPYIQCIVQPTPPAGDHDAMITFSIY